MHQVALVLIIGVAVTIESSTHRPGLKTISGSLHLKNLNNAVNDQKRMEKWQYVNVRPSAFMFWWLYLSTNSGGYQSQPLVIWLQGGPGGSSTGFGNFQEIGPLDVQLQPRKYSWVTEASLLFIDNPVGTGFSYVTDDSAYTTDVNQIAKDLVTVMKNFLKENNEFQSIPVYIFSESYGGKMTAVFSQQLLQAISSAQLKCDFRGFAMGDSWISPIDSVLTWAPYLFATSLIDERGLKEINEVAIASKEAVVAGQWKRATKLWSKAEGLVANKTNGVNFYNILDWRSKPQPQKFQQSAAFRHLGAFTSDDLANLMNGPIRKKLGIIPENVTWGGQSGKVFDKQEEDFMKPVVHVVETLLESSLKIVVYSGQLDLIVDTMGTEKWVQQLAWPDLPQFNSANRTALTDDTGATTAFVKEYKNFSFYWILGAGHMIPADQPKTAINMLRRIIQ